MKLRHWEISGGVGVAGNLFYMRIDPATVFYVAGLRERNGGLRSLLIPYLYFSNAQRRIEWGFLGYHKIYC